MKILVCRLAWMETYSSVNEIAIANHRYVQQGNTPYEALNFSPDENGVNYGYVRVSGDLSQDPGNIDITKLGVQKTDNIANDVTVVFVATEPISQNLLVVGFYENATVHRHSFAREDSQGEVGTIVRMTSREATLIPVERRCFAIPRGKGAVGQSDLWYGLASDEKKRRTPQRHVELSPRCYATAGERDCFLSMEDNRGS